MTSTWGCLTSGWSAGGRLGVEDVDRRAGDLAGVERLGQRGLVDQAAAGAVDDPHARLHLARSRAAPMRLRVSAESGVCSVM